MAVSPCHSRGLSAMGRPESALTVAIFAADLATSLPHHCRFLPLLPSITRNDKLSSAANRLEFGIWPETTLDITLKSGKNGNVHHSSQHCRQL
jgi:hypothetical protein